MVLSVIAELISGLLGADEDVGEVGEAGEVAKIDDGRVVVVEVSPGVSSTQLNVEYVGSVVLPSSSSSVVSPCFFFSLAHQGASRLSSVRFSSISMLPSLRVAASCFSLVSPETSHRQMSASRIANFRACRR